MAEATVLDELAIRTAEASRLRRRGALRIDYRRHVTHDEGQYYTLFCRGDYDSPSSSPYKPSILPLIRTSGPEQLEPTPKACGTLLHVSAAPHAQSHTWHAPPSGASPALVPLDATYVPDPTALRIYRAPCGCTREAIACATCGTILGTHFSSCAVSSHSHSRSWLRTQTYTFLGTAVTSLPSYTHQSAPYQPPPQTQTQTQTYPPLLDRLITASPTPLSDDERAAYRHELGDLPPSAYVYPYGYGDEDDADGVGWRGSEHEEWDDPGSPDKAAEGVFLVPER